MPFESITVMFHVLSKTEGINCEQKIKKNRVIENKENIIVSMMAIQWQAAYHDGNPMAQASLLNFGVHDDRKGFFRQDPRHIIFMKHPCQAFCESTMLFRFANLFHIGIILWPNMRGLFSNLINKLL